jgi:DNA adenine methylase
MPATYTPLRYPGGKTKYSNLFVDTIFLNDLQDCTFVEVFAGGAGAAISLLLKGHVKSLFLNDLDIAIYAFWKSVKEQPKELIQLIKSTRISMAEWKRQKAIYDAKDASDLLTLGFATLFLNRCNHSGILQARPIGGMKQNGEYNIKSRFNKDTSIKKIKAISEKADSIEVFNEDGVGFLNYLNRKYSKRNFLIYFDPPYYQKGPALYLNHFSHDDHLELSEEILKCDSPWVLSYDNHDPIIEMYSHSECNLYTNNIRHTITGNYHAQELVISRLNLPEYLNQLSL